MFIFPRSRLASAIGLISAIGLPAHAQDSLELDSTNVVSTVVSAAGFEQKITEAPASINVISQEELQQKRYSSLADALVDVEGVDVRGATGKTGGLSISIRGMPSDYTLILIDGRRQNAAGDVTPNGFGETSTSFIPPLSAIERIEVIRGPMSTLYGSDAMGGVVNIITKKVADHWSSSLTLDHTVQENRDAGDTSNLNFYTSGPLVQGLAGLALRGSLFDRGESDLQPEGAGSSSSTISKRGPSPVEGRNHSLGGKLTLTPVENHDFWLDVDQARQRYENDESQLGNLDLALSGRNGARISGYTDVQRFEREQYAIGHTSRLAIGTLDSSLMRNQTETIGRTIPGSNAGGDLGQPSGIPGKLIGDARELKTTNLVLDSKLSSEIGTQHRLTSGIQWWRAKMTDGIATSQFKQTTWALFAEDEWRLREDLAMTLGARYDDHDAFGGHVSPRAYLVWNPTTELTVKGGVSRGYKTPQLNQLHSGITGVTAQGAQASVGNPDLDPETSTSTELGLYYDNYAGFNVNATLFHNAFKDKISSTNRFNCNYENTAGATPNLGQPGCYDLGGYNAQETVAWAVNLDEATTQGLELAATFPLLPSWSLYTNYTYTENELKQDGKKDSKLSDTPRHMFNARLNWQATDRLNTWLRAEYRGESRRFDSHKSELSGDDLRLYQVAGDTLKGYGVFHLGGSYKATANLTLNAAIYNLLDKNFLKFDKSYVNGQGDTVYLNDYIHSTRSTKGTIQEGRRLWLSANLTF